MENNVIEVRSLHKMYKLYEKKSDRLREALSPRKKQYYKPFYALQDISFDVKKGETVGIIGTNGGGKSTLLKILTGVVAATSGDLSIIGRVSALLELGTGFNMEYTGVQNIDLHGTIMGFSKEEIEARKKEIIDFADIGDYIYQPVKNYSSGMFARLAFAVAISVEPEILIVDEALSVGDVFFQSKCFRKFDELREKGVSILFVSHDISSVRKLCSRVLWIEHGHQMMFGACEEVCDQYFNAQMNRLNEENLNYQVDAQDEEVKEDESEKTVIRPKVRIASNSVLSEKAEILSAYVRDGSGMFVKNMKADQTYTIGIVSKFNETLDHVIVGFTLRNRKGIDILANNTYAATGETLHMEKGDLIETTFAIKMPKIRSGEYEISPAIACGVQSNHVNLTWLHGALGIFFERGGYEISEIGTDPVVKNRKLEGCELIDE